MMAYGISGSQEAHWFEALTCMGVGFEGCEESFDLQPRAPLSGPHGASPDCCIATFGKELMFDRA